jgi:hypothetical protein
MQFAEQITLTSSTLPVSVRIDVEFEHAMGASIVHLVPSVPVGGQSHFWTHNGFASFSSDGTWLFLFDSTLLLCVDLTRDAVYHAAAPHHQFHAKVYTRDGQLCREVHDPGGRPGALPEIPLADIPLRLSKGLGPVKAGRFPSA